MEPGERCLPKDLADEEPHQCPKAAGASRDLILPSWCLLWLLVFFVLKPLKYKVKLEAMVFQLTFHSGKVAAANSRGEGVCARAGTQGQSLSSSV